MKKRTRTALYVLLGCMTSCCLGGFVVVRVMGAGSATEVERERVVARKIGMPLEVSDLLQPQVEDSENAAKIYSQIADIEEREADEELKSRQAYFAKHPPDFSGGGATFAPHPASMSPDEFKARRMANILRHRPIYDLLEQLHKYPKCFLPFGWHQSEKQHRAGYSQAIFTLSMTDSYLNERARFNIDRGNFKAGMRDLRLGERVLTDLLQIPSIHAFQTALNCFSMNHYLLLRLIGREANDPRALETCFELIRSEPMEFDERLYFVGEVVLNRTEIRTAEKLRDIGLTLDPDRIGLEAPNSPLTSLEKTFVESRQLKDTLDEQVLQDWETVWESFPPDPSDWHGFDLAFQRFQPSKADNQNWDFLNRPEVYEIGDEVATHQAWRRMLLTAIGALKIRVRMGSIPQSIPANHDDNAIDPFTKKRFEYHVTRRGFELKSVGSAVEADKLPRWLRGLHPGPQTLSMRWGPTLR